MDTNQNKSFDESAMTDYKVNFDVQYFGTNNSATAVAERMPLVVQTNDKDKFVNIGIVSGAHGSHVAGIAAGNSLFGGQMSGAAPGAKIVSSRACLFVAGCTASALTDGMIYVAKQANVDVINQRTGGVGRRGGRDRLVAPSNPARPGGPASAGPLLFLPCPRRVVVTCATTAAASTTRSVADVYRQAHAVVEIAGTTGGATGSAPALGRKGRWAPASSTTRQAGHIVTNQYVVDGAESVSGNSGGPLLDLEAESSASTRRSPASRPRPWPRRCGCAHRSRRTRARALLSASSGTPSPSTSPTRRNASGSSPATNHCSG
ncbi:MAG: S8 family serine peptidase [Actinobacteria bacterium]|nr:S8 family serine peptidase [Actinomycetota bacterium]